MKKILIFLLIVSVSLMFLVISIEQNAYNKRFYMNKYEDNNIEAITGKDTEELGDITEDLFLYLKGGEDDLLRPHFNEKEILHMEDVRSLFDLARNIKYIALVVILFCLHLLLKNKNTIVLAKSFLYGLFINHILLAVVGILAYIDFNKYFTYFHLLFFENDLWILNPKTDLMIQMLPENFFSGMALNIMLSFLFYITLIQIVSYLYIKKNKKTVLQENKS